MKTTQRRWQWLVVLMMAFAATVRALNPCIQQISTNWICLQQGTLVSNYTLAPTNIFVEVGQPITPPTVWNLTMTNSSEQGSVSFKCTPNQDYSITNPISYTFGDLYFVPSLPQSLGTAGTNYYDAYVVAYGNACSPITNYLGTVTVVVTNGPPAIVTPPLFQTVLVGDTATFNVAAAGTEPLSYQWFFNGNPLGGETGDTLTLTNAQLTQTGDYSVQVTNVYGAVQSDAALGVISTNAIYLSGSTNAEINGWYILNASVMYTNTSWPPYHGDIVYCQWTNVSNPDWYIDVGMVRYTGWFGYKLVTTISGNNCFDQGAASGEYVPTTSSLSPNGPWAPNISCLAGDANIVGNQISPTNPPVIITPPFSQTVTAGGGVTFNVGVAGTGPFTYQWQLNGSNLPNDIIITVAGNGTNGYSGDGGAAINATLYEPGDAVVDASGNLFIADQLNNCIRKVDTRGIITTVAGNGTNGFSGDGGPATNASLNYPNGVAVDAAGNLFIADTGNNRIRKVDTNGIISTVVGSSSVGYSGDNGAATNAGLYSPNNVAVDAADNLFIADTLDQRIRKVNFNGIITTVAGNGSNGCYTCSTYSGDNVAATNSSLNYPIGVAVDAVGNLYIADSSNERIRKVDTNGIITTVAGNGSPSYSGDGGVATNATLHFPVGVTVDPSGNLFIADWQNNRIREVNSDGIITTVAGNGPSNPPGVDQPGSYSGDGGVATNASIYNPSSAALDAVGNLFIADTGNNRIREVRFAGSSTLTLTNVTAADLGNYTVVVTSPYGSVTSSSAILQLTSPFTLTIAGSPSIRSIACDRLAYLFDTGYTCVSNGVNLITFQGTMSSRVPALGDDAVTVYCSFSNSVSGIQALELNSAVPVVQSNGAAAYQPPNLVFSTLFPSTIGYGDWQFDRTAIGVLPYVLICNNVLQGMNNVTPTLASWLLQYSGPSPDTNYANALPASDFDISSPASVYLVGDADADLFTFLSTYFNLSTNAIVFWTTNSAGQYSNNGQYYYYHGVYDQPNLLDIYSSPGNQPAYSYGTAPAMIKSLPDSLGFVTMAQYNSVSANVTPASYNGVPFSSANVANGSYALWGYEQILNQANGLTINQQMVRDALIDAITNSSYETTPTFSNSFIPLANMQVNRVVDGGLITPQQF